MAYAESPKGLTKWQQFLRNARGFGKFFYDKEKGEVMGRGAASWGKITLFFVVFYLCLAAFFAAMLNAFLATMPPITDGPKLTQYLAGKSALITGPSYKIAGFDQNDPKDYRSYVDLINKFLAPYKEQNSSDYSKDYCNFNSTEAIPKGEKQCQFDLSQLGPCYNGDDKNFTYGYKDGNPCFFIRMNKVFNWVPEPEGDLSYIKLECSGADAQVFPKATPGFSVSFFPFRGGNWLAPIAAVQVKGTKDKEIKCNAYAKNVERSDTYLLERGAYNRIRINIK